MPSFSQPMPVVVIKTPSALPRSTTLVSPATTGTPAAREAAPMDRTIFSNNATSKPSSMMNPAVSDSGSAPMTATSLTVPCTANWPISPPGKNKGVTT